MIEADFEIGEEVSEEVKLIDLGRRAILALRQNLISKIHEHDNKQPQAYGIFIENRLDC
jgi:N utilization substance protein A